MLGRAMLAQCWFFLARFTYTLMDPSIIIAAVVVAIIIIVFFAFRYKKRSAAAVAITSVNTSAAIADDVVKKAALPAVPPVIITDTGTLVPPVIKPPTIELPTTMTIGTRIIPIGDIIDPNTAEGIAKIKSEVDAAKPPTSVVSAIFETVGTFRIFKGTTEFTTIMGYSFIGAKLPNVIAGIPIRDERFPNAIIIFNREGKVAIVAGNWAGWMTETGTIPFTFPIPESALFDTAIATINETSLNADALATINAFNEQVDATRTVSSGELAAADMMKNTIIAPIRSTNTIECAIVGFAGSMMCKLFPTNYKNVFVISGGTKYYRGVIIKDDEHSHLYVCAIDDQRNGVMLQIGPSNALFGTFPLHAIAQWQISAAVIAPARVMRSVSSVGAPVVNLASSDAVAVSQ